MEVPSLATAAWRRRSWGPLLHKLRIPGASRANTSLVGSQAVHTLSRPASVRHMPFRAHALTSSWRSSAGESASWAPIPSRQARRPHHSQSTLWSDKAQQAMSRLGLVKAATGGGSCSGSARPVLRRNGTAQRRTYTTTAAGEGNISIRIEVSVSSLI